MIHPGEILLDNFLKPAGKSLEEFAEQSGLSLETLQELTEQRRGINHKIALKLSVALHTSVAFWVIAQKRTHGYIN